jgi:CMP-N-acetylneuraminic acid synthetase
LVHLRPTCPLRRASDIDLGVRILLDNPEADSVRAVIPAKNHPLKTYRLEKGILCPFIDGSLYGLPGANDRPRQSLPPAFATSGYFTAFRPRALLHFGTLTGGSMLGFEVNSDSAIDIDTLEDFNKCAAVLRSRKRASLKVQPH